MAWHGAGPACKPDLHGADGAVAVAVQRGQAEVREARARLGAAGQQHVLRLEVAVHKLQRVQVVEA